MFNHLFFLLNQSGYGNDATSMPHRRPRHDRRHDARHRHLEGPRRLQYGGIRSRSLHAETQRVRPPLGGDRVLIRQRRHGKRRNADLLPFLH